MLNLEQAKLVYDGLKIGYRRVESRMQYNRNRKYTFNENDICMHLIGYDLPSEIQKGVPMYETSVNDQIKKIIDPYIKKCISIIESQTKKVDQLFLIMSTNWCGKSRHVKHLHTLLQRNPDRCITLSLPIPLYIDENSSDYHKFFWNYRDNLYPKITYTSQERMEKIDVEYSSFDIPKTQQCSLLFDSSRTLHYINNTNHLYLWLVCDAVYFDDRDIVNGCEIKIHQ